MQQLRSKNTFWEKLVQRGKKIFSLITDNRTPSCKRLTWKFSTFFDKMIKERENRSYFLTASILTRHRLSPPARSAVVVFSLPSLHWQSWPSKERREQWVLRASIISRTIPRNFVSLESEYPVCKTNQPTLFRSEDFRSARQWDQPTMLHYRTVLRNKPLNIKHPVLKTTTQHDKKNTKTRSGFTRRQCAASICLVTSEWSLVETIRKKKDGCKKSNDSVRPRSPYSHCSQS